MKYYYEIHVIGKNGFSTYVISDNELTSDDDIINLAYSQGKLEDDDANYVDYVQELTFNEWKEYFNVQ